MLDAALRAATQPQTNEKNIVYFLDYRISVLGEGVFRLEKSPDKKFRDKATQAVWFRTAKAQEYTLQKKEEGLSISTAKATLIVKEKREDCYVRLGEKHIPLDNAENLGGTYRTLDCCDGENIRENSIHRENIIGKVDLGRGVCSKNGVAVYDDSNSLSLSEEGEVLPERANGTDEYIFVFPNDYRGAVKAFYELTGYTPLLPRYALGNWWSRYYPYSDKEYLQLMDKFEEEDIPLTVAVMDMAWHCEWPQEIDETYGITKSGRTAPEYGGTDGWTGYTWNKRLFPNHVAFLKELHDRNLRVTLNLHPADGLRWWETRYREFAEKLGEDPDSCKQMKFDVSSDYINAYFSVIIGGLEDEGVDFWWIDWQQGEISSVEGLDPLWINNHFHTLDSQRRHERGLTLSRYSGVGSHRYPLGFSGDSYMTWNTLRYLPYFTATASNVGYTWWSHDIGGHMFGETSFELYLRNLQFGVFSPINRLHSANMSIVTKEPWMYGNGTGEIAKKLLRLRHAMLPFLYSVNYQTHTEGKALVEPLYYAYPTCEEAYDVKEEYLFGGLLVAPVTEKLSKDGYAPVSVWLPEGKWTDIFTGDEYEVSAGGKKKVLCRSLDSIPVLAKAGTILPLSLDKGNGVKNPSRLAVEAYAGDGEFTLFEDNEGGMYALTRFEGKLEEGLYTLKIGVSGNREVIPENRSMKILFRSIAEGEICVLEDGKPVQGKEKNVDCASVEFAFAPDKEYEIRIRFAVVNKLERLKQTALNVLTRAEGENEEKEKAYLRILKANGVEEYLAAVRESRLSEGVKARLTETLL